MIAGPSCNVPFGNAIDPGGIVIPGTLYGFDGIYVSADTVKSGYGYWLRANAAGAITLQCGSGGAVTKSSAADLSESPSIEIRDALGATQTLHCRIVVKDTLARLALSLPTVAPAGSFDARFAGDYRAVEGNGGTIRVQSSHYPLTVRTTENSATSKVLFDIAEMFGGTQVKLHRLKSGVRVEIADERVTELLLTVTLNRTTRTRLTRQRLSTTSCQPSDT